MTARPPSNEPVASASNSHGPTASTSTLPAPARTASGDGQSSIFISYSRRDVDFVHALYDALVARGFAVWVDWEDIPYGADFPSEILDNIERNDIFLFVLSPDSLASEWCGKELAHAEENKKRIMPVVCRDVNPTQVPPSLGHLNWLFMRADDPFVTTLDKLATAISMDLDWVKVHSWLLQRAGRWDRAGRNPSMLMRGGELQEADAWLTQATVNGGKRPAPVELQAVYVTLSRRAQRARQRVRLALTALVAALALVAMAVGAFAAAAEHDKQLANQKAALAAFKSQQEAQAKLVADAVAQTAADPELGVLLAAQAVQRYPVTLAAQAALQQALAASRVRAALRGHSDKVMSVAFSPDGQRVLTASYDGTAREWDAATGRETALLVGSTGALSTAMFDRRGMHILTGGGSGAQVWDAATGRSLVTLRWPGTTVAAISPDGRRVVTAGAGLALWDARTGKRLAMASGYTVTVESAAFDRRGARAVTAGDDGTARVWDAASGRLLATMRGHGCIPDQASPGGRVCSVYDAVFSPDGRRVLTAGVDHTARVWDATTGRQVLSLVGHTSWVYRAVFSPDGTRIATAGGDEMVRVWDARTGAPVATLSGHMDAIDSLAFSPDSRRIVTAGNDRTARVWDAATGQSLLVLRGHRDEVHDAVFSPDGRRVATASYDDTARVWDVTTGRALSSWHKDGVAGAAYSTDGRYVLTTGWASTAHTTWTATARLWDAHTGRVLFTLTGDSRRPQPIDSMAFSLDNRRVATAALDGAVRIWDIPSHRLIAVLRHPGPVDSVTFSDDGGRVATALGTDADTAYVWDVRTKRLITTLRPNGWTGTMYGAAFSSGPGTRVVTASSDGTVREWDARTGKPWSRNLTYFPAVTISTAGTESTAMFSPNNRLLLTSGASNAVELWDADTGERVAVLDGHIAAVSSASFSPDSRYLATAGADGTLRIWDVAARRQIDLLSPSLGPLNYAAFTRDGRRIVVSASSGTTTIYACDVCTPARRLVANLLASVPAHVTRTLTTGEWGEYLPDQPQPASVRSVRDLFDGIFTGALPLKSPYSTYTYGYGWDAQDHQGVYVVRKVDRTWNAPVSVVLPDPYTNVRLAVDARLLPGAGQRVVDLGCRQSEGAINSGYRLTVYPDGGDVILVRWLKGAYKELAHMTLTPDALHPGDAWNRLALSCVGQKITASVNGKTVITRSDATFRSGLIWLGPAINRDSGLYTVEAHFRRLAVDRL